MNRLLKVIFIFLIIVFGMWGLYYFHFNIKVENFLDFIWFIFPISIIAHFLILFYGPFGMIKIIRLNSFKKGIIRNLLLIYFTIGIAILPLVFALSTISLFMIIVTDVKDIEKVSINECLKMLSLFLYSGVSFINSKTGTCG